MTDSERKLWTAVRGNRLGLKFRRQVPFGPYILDFLCSKAKLNIELDGSQHGTPEAVMADKKRDNYLRSLGYAVLRYSNLEVLRNTDGVAEDILEHLDTQESK